MIGRLQVLCFAATYGLALGAELARFAVRGAVRWYATVGLTAAAWVIHSAYLLNLASREHGPPVTTAFESLLVLAWILAAIDLYLVVRSPKTLAVGVFLLPLVLALVTVAGLWAPRDHWAGWGGGWLSFWVRVHIAMLVMGAVFTSVAFAAGLMYLVQANRLKHKRPPRFGFSLPSLEKSESLNRGSIAVAFPLLSSGFVIGMALIVATSRSGVLGWSDPKVLSAGALWGVFALLLHARFRPAMRGRRVMVLTVVAFAFLVFTWVGVGLIFPTAHGAPRPSAGRPS